MSYGTKRDDPSIFWCSNIREYIIVLDNRPICQSTPYIRKPGMDIKQYGYFSLDILFSVITHDFVIFIV